MYGRTRRLIASGVEWGATSGKLLRKLFVLNTAATTATTTVGDIGASCFLSVYVLLLLQTLRWDFIRAVGEKLLDLLILTEHSPLPPVMERITT